MGSAPPGQPLVDLWFGLVGDTVSDAHDATVVATDLWSALHGTVALRRDLPAFAWPTTRESAVDRLLAALVPTDAPGGRERLG